MSLTATTGTGLPEEDFEYLRELMHLRAAIVLEPGKEYLALSRLQPVARDHGLTTVSELVDKLRKRELTSALHDQVIDALTTNETTYSLSDDFIREPDGRTAWYRPVRNDPVGGAGR